MGLPHFTNKEPGTDRVNDFAKITELVSDKFPDSLITLH